MNTKMTRAELQMLWSQNQERLRIRQITEVVNDIYRHVVGAATNEHTPTLHRYEFNNSIWHHRFGKKFLEANMQEILEKVCDLFPDCEVSYTYCEVSYSKNGSFIVVDWS